MQTNQSYGLRPGQCFYDTANGHRLEFEEYRGNGTVLFRDISAKHPTRVVCTPETVSYHPPVDKDGNAKYSTIRDRELSQPIRAV